VRYFRGLLRFAFWFAALAVSATAAFAQTTASIRGTITDQSGAVVAGAKVALTNAGTGVSRVKMSTADGSYLFDYVQVGTYKVSVEKSGFTTFVQDGIVLELNQNGRLDVALKIGQETQTVEVTSNIAQVDTTGAVLGKVENQRMINDLPLVDRDTLQLGLLQAGVFTPDPDDGSGNPFSVSGQRSESLTFLLDGGNNTDFLGNNIVVSPNPDAVEEFKILTNNYDAQYGRTSGGIVNQITRSGTNSFHGDAFEFLRNDVFNARDYFLPPSQPKSAFKRNDYGATLGGPIRKDKTFFFLSYEGRRRIEGQQSPQLTVLDQAERGGDFSEDCSGGFDGSGNCLGSGQLVNPVTGANYPFNQVPVNPVIANYISKYLPLPNLPNNGYISAPSASTYEDQGIAHIDHNWGTHDTFSFVYLVDDVRSFNPLLGGDVPVGSGGSTNYRDQIGTLAWTHTFNTTMVNEFRFAANRTATDQSIPADRTTPAALGFTNLNPDDPKGAAPPAIFTANFNLGPSIQGPTTLDDNTFEWADTFTWTRGKHELKFGGDFTRLELNFNYDYYNNGGFQFGADGSFTGDVQADFVGGFYDNYYQNSKAVYGIRTGSMAGFAQDTWKVSSRFTFDYGLRYEYYIPQYDVHNEILGFFAGRQSTIYPSAPPDILYPGDPGTPNRALVYPDKNNFAPRVGFAWDMFGNAKLVMRGGGGIFYDIEDGALNLQFGGLPPFGGVANNSPTGYTVSSGYNPAVDPVADPFNSFGLTNVFPFTPNGQFGVPAISYGYATNPHFRTPYSENFNYGFQWQASADTMVEAVYVGSLGRKLISTGELNYPVPSVMEQQLVISQAYPGGPLVNPDCARPLAACTGGISNNPIDPTGSPTGIQQLFTNFSNGLSDSDEFQLTVDKRLSKSFALRAAYTISKTIDLTSGFRSRSSTYTDPLDPRLDRSVADFDSPQRLVISGIWELPFAKPFGDNTIMKKVAGGWQFNGIATFQKGQPITFYNGENASEQNNYLDRVDVVGPIAKANPRNPNQTFTSDCLGGSSTGNFWIDPTNLICTPCPPSDPTCSQGEVGIPLFTYGTLSRNALRGPGINNFDLSLTKRTQITESKSLEFRAEFFNAFNHAQFLNPANTGDTGTFGQISTTRQPRLIQFGLKFYY
jgi:hypothetical protein